MRIIPGENMVIEKYPAGSEDYYVSTTAKDNYTALSNKPSINNITLDGNLTTANLGLSDTWELISENTSDELVSSYIITTDKDGQPFSLKKWMLIQTTGIVNSWSSSSIYFTINDIISFSLRVMSSSENQHLRIYAKSNFIDSSIGWETIGGQTSTNSAQYTPSYMSGKTTHGETPKTYATKLGFYSSGSTNIGFQFKLYGVRSNNTIPNLDNEVF